MVQASWDVSFTKPGEPWGHSAIAELQQAPAQIFELCLKVGYERMK